MGIPHWPGLGRGQDAVAPHSGFAHRRDLEPSLNSLGPAKRWKSMTIPMRLATNTEDCHISRQGERWEQSKICKDNQKWTPDPKPSTLAWSVKVKAGLSRPTLNVSSSLPRFNTQIQYIYKPALDLQPFQGVLSNFTRFNKDSWKRLLLSVVIWLCLGHRWTRWTAVDGRDSRLCLLAGLDVGREKRQVGFQGVVEMIQEPCSDWPLPHQVFHLLHPHSIQVCLGHSLGVFRSWEQPAPPARKICRGASAGNVFWIETSGPRP